MRLGVSLTQLLAFLCRHQLSTLFYALILSFIIVRQLQTHTCTSTKELRMGGVWTFPDTYLFLFIYLFIFIF
jgi:hypothetical protein